MTTRAKLAVLAVTGIFVAACALSTSPFPTLTPTLRPTYTPPPSPTPSPTQESTSTPEAGFQLPLPRGAPLESWHSIPIMPGALTGGELVAGGYTFTTLASPASIEQFYIHELQTLGWDYVATGTTESGGLLIIFSKSTSVSVLPIGDPDGTNYVLIIAR